jgi:hypothetical protein
MKTVFVFPPLRKHLAGGHDQSSHGSWAGASRTMSAKEREVLNRINNVEIKTNDNVITAKANYLTPDNKTVELTLFAVKGSPMTENEIAYRSLSAGWTADYAKPNLTKLNIQVTYQGRGIGDLDTKEMRNNLGSLNENFGIPTGYSEIQAAWVAEDFRRLGIASAMLAFARRVSPIPVEHSTSLSDDGRAFSVTTKHLAGQHDQITHGSWAGRGLATNIVEDMKSYYGTTFEEFKKSEAFKRISEKTVQAHVTNTNVGDVNLEFVAEKQGFDGKPKVVTPEQMDALEKDGWTIAYRGIIDGETISGDPISADSIVDEFINGKYYGGRGTSGNGTYFAESKEVAEYYAQGGSTTPETMFGQSGARTGKVIKVAIPKGTMMSAFDFQDAVVEHRENVKSKKLWWNGDDIGVALAAQGYRGTEQIRGLPMNPSEAYKVYVIWDRSMLAVEEIK